MTDEKMEGMSSADNSRLAQHLRALLLRSQSDWDRRELGAALLRTLLLGAVAWLIHPVLLLFVPLLAFNRPPRGTSGQYQQELQEFRNLALDNLLRRGLLQEVLTANSEAELLGSKALAGYVAEPFSPQRFESGPRRLDFLIRDYELLCFNRAWPYLSTHRGETPQNLDLLSFPQRRELIMLLLDILEGNIAENA